MDSNCLHYRLRLTSLSRTKHLYSKVSVFKQEFLVRDEYHGVNSILLSAAPQNPVQKWASCAALRLNRATWWNKGITQLREAVSAVGALPSNLVWVERGLIWQTCAGTWEMIQMHILLALLRWVQYGVDVPSFLSHMLVLPLKVYLDIAKFESRHFESTFWTIFALPGLFWVLCQKRNMHHKFPKHCITKGFILIWLVLSKLQISIRMNANQAKDKIRIIALTEWNWQLVIAWVKISTANEWSGAHNK